MESQVLLLIVVAVLAAAVAAGLVSWRLKAETRRAREQADMMTRLAEALPLPVAVFDAGQRCRYANAPFLDLLGAAGADPGGVTAERLRSIAGGHLAAALQRTLGGTPESFETSLALRSASRPARLSLVPGEGGTALLTVEDLSDRRRAEEQRREIEATTHAILEAAADGIITIDARGAIESFNRAAEGIFGYRAAEVLGRNVKVLMPSPDRDAHDQYLANYLATGQAKIIGIGREVQGLRKDGSIFPMDLAVGESRVEGRRIFAGIVRDITDRKHAEKVLRRAMEDAERANLGKSKFLAAASHDLRQPVQALFFFTAALARRLRDHPAREVLADLQRSLESLNMLLDSLLDISKLDAGIVTPNVTSFSVGSLLDRMEGDFGPAARAKRLDLRVVPSTATIRSDPTLLSRVVQNLVANAVRYTSQGRILVGCRRRGGALRIEVRDTGIGIPQERLDDIFEEFYQVANPERDRNLGLGLGLAIVHRLARLLNHRVTVSSSLGRGSVFAVEVPLGEVQPDLPAGRRTAAAPSSAGPRLVVIIDDEVPVLKGLRMILEEWGFEVLAATSEEEAIRLLEEMHRPPNAIVADYRLRDGRTGTEAIRHIRDLFHAPIPSIIITGDTAPERLREAEASGLSILHKPVQPPELQTLLNRTIAPN